MRVELYKYDLPVEGPSLLFVGKCTSCGTRISDVIPLKTGKEITLIYETNPETLRKIIYLPGDTDIEIPELGVEIRLTPAFKGKITTIEGILRMIEDEVDQEELRKKISDIIEGKKKVKIIIKNRTGLLKEVKI